MTHSPTDAELPIRVELAGQSTDLAVRDLMQQIHDVLHHAALPPDLSSSVEIALAEVLNNIVEHACGDRPDGRISVAVTLAADHVFVGVQDTGHPMPGGALPAGLAADVSVDTDDLPEGGFGWHMIRSLSNRLEYHRIGQTNHLSIWFAITGES